MNTEVEKEINFGKILIFALILAVAIIVFGTAYFSEKRDSDCLEWGVYITHRDGTNSWAITPYDPKTREEAEQIAKQLENQDMGNRYYEARCKRYK